MSHAYLKKNLDRLSFELKIVFLVHVLTMFFCLAPWFSAVPLYDDPFYYTAFEGSHFPGFMIGICIFLVSFIVSAFFGNKMVEYRRVVLPFSENKFYVMAGGQQIVLLVLMWSVLFSMGQDFESSEIRFGFFATFIAQVAGLTAALLHIKNVKQRSVRELLNSFKVDQLPREEPAPPVLEKKPLDPDQSGVEIKINH